MFGRPAKTTYPQGGLQVTEYAKRRFKWIFLVQGGDKFTKVWSRGGSDLSYFGVNKSPVTAPLGHRYSVNDIVVDNANGASTFAELPLSELPADITFLTHAARYGDITGTQLSVLASTLNNNTSNYCFINLGNGYAPTKNAAHIENGGNVTIGASTIYDAATGRKLVVGSSVIASKQDVFFGASFKNVSGNTFRLHGMGRFAFPHGMQLMAIADSAIVGEELERVTADPYGMLFASDSKSLWVPETVSAGGGATVIPIGVQATGSVGTPSVTGAANATPAGVSTTASVGTPTAAGGSSIAATALPAGVAASSAVGAPAAIGAAVAQPVGVSASSAVGVPVAIAGTSIPATVLPTGVQAFGAVGTPTVTAAAIAQPLGVAATAYVGTPTIATGVSGVAVAYPAGVQAIGQVGTLIATGAAWTAAVGVQAVASVGTPSAYAGELVIYTSGAQTRPSRLQSSSRPSRLQSSSRASR